MQKEVKGSKPEFRLATRQDAVDLAPRLRAEDLEELEKGFALPPEIALKYSLAVSDIAYAITVDGKVVALFGIVSALKWDSDVGPGLPWLLAAPEIVDFRKSLLRVCKGYIEDWLKVHGVLEGYVWPKNEVHVKWLKWLGFKFDEPTPFGIDGEPFTRFYMKEEEICAAPPLFQLQD